MVIAIVKVYVLNKDIYFHLCADISQCQYTFFLS